MVRYWPRRYDNNQPMQNSVQNSQSTTQQTSQQTSNQQDVEGYDKLRQLGSTIQNQEKALGIRAKDIREAKSDRRELEKDLIRERSDLRRSLKRRYDSSDDPRVTERLARFDETMKARLADQDAVIAERQSSYDARAEQYSSFVAQYTPETVQRARSSAPKAYHTGGRGVASLSELRQEKQYQESDKALLREVQERPGIIKGSQFKSQLYRSRYSGGTYTGFTEGTYNGNRGNVVITQRSVPFTSVKSGRTEFKLLPKQQPKTYNAIDLYNPRNQDALRQMSASGEYRTVGALFAGPQYTPNNEPSKIVLNKNTLEGAGSERYQAVERVSGFVSRYQTGFEQRTSRLDRTLSRYSFGGGVPYEQRSFVGKLGQTGVGIVTDPIWGPAAYGDATVLATQKSFLYTGALITPETSKSARKELVSNLGVFKTVYSDPSTYAYALTGGIAKGYFNYNVARRTPSSIKVKSYYAVVDKPVVQPGSVSATGVLSSTATVTYRYGPMKMFSRQQTVPVQGNFIFSGSEMLSGKTPRVYGRLDTMASLSIPSVRKGKTSYKTFYSGNSYDAVYRPASGALSLIDDSRTNIVFSRPGRGVVPSPAKGFDADLMTAPSLSARFTKNKYGIFTATETSTGRGFSYPNLYRSRQLVGRKQIIGSYVDITDKKPSVMFGRVGYSAEINKGMRVLSNPSDRAIYTSSVGGANYRMSRAGFNDLSAAGLYEKITIRDKGISAFGIRQRRGNVRVSAETVFSPEQSRVPVKTPSISRYKNIRSPVFSGLVPPSFGVKSGMRFGFVPVRARAQNRSLSSANKIIPSVKMTPSVFSGLDRASVSRLDSGTRTDYVLRQSSMQRTTVSRSVAPSIPFPPSFSPPRSFPPFIPPLLPFGGGSVNAGFSGGLSSRRGYKYAPSFIALDLGIKAKRGRSQKRVFTGFELRPIR